MCLLVVVVVVVAAAAVLVRWEELVPGLVREHLGVGVLGLEHLVPGLAKELVHSERVQVQEQAHKEPLEQVAWEVLLAALELWVRVRRAAEELVQ